MSDELRAVGYLVLFLAWGGLLYASIRWGEWE